MPEIVSFLTGLLNNCFYTTQAEADIIFLIIFNVFESDANHWNLSFLLGFRATRPVSQNSQ